MSSIEEIEETISAACSKISIDMYAAQAIAEPNLVRQLWQIASADKPYAWKAAWILATATKADHSSTRCIAQEVYDAIPATKNLSQIREYIKIIHYHPLPSDASGELLDFCLEAIINRNLTVGVRMHCMDLAARYCDIYPEITSELVSILEEVIAEAPSVGTVHWAKRIVRQITKEE